MRGQLAMPEQQRLGTKVCQFATNNATLLPINSGIIEIYLGIKGIENMTA
jgi:hypothetical protein